MIQVQPVHYLNHPTRVRYYRFTPRGETVEVEKVEGPWTAERKTLTVSKARSLYAWLQKLGYSKW